MIEILIVDDNPGDALLVKQFLSEGYVVRATIAEDGEQAMLLLMRPDYRPDLILLDLKIPRLDGQEVLKQIRRKITATVPVVVLSASQDPEDIDKAYAHGANAYVEKPVDLEGLMSMVKTIARMWVEPLCRPYA